MDIFNAILQVVILVAIGVWAFLWKSYGSKYLEEKGKNLATKQDVEEITRRIEGVKADIAKAQSIHKAQFELKHQACLEALALVDCHFSHTLEQNSLSSPTKQFSTAEKARACHSKLIISCEDTKLLNTFFNIMFPDPKGKPPTDLLNDFRNLVRHELGFGGELQLHREVAWFGTVGFEDHSKDAKPELAQIPVSQLDIGIKGGHVMEKVPSM